MNNIRLLLVDDEEDFRITLTARLKRRNIDVVDVSSGEKAIELIRNNKFDVVIVDIKMPGIDGIETLRYLKRIDPLLEVILLTGHASVEAGIEGIKLGAYDYIVKPCNLNDLLSKVEDAHRRRHIEEERIREK
ncbi:MAG: response regulator [Proteobacteria bacterium]|nr:response regulator [Pseudomonadota bacterium]